MKLSQYINRILFFILPMLIGVGCKSNPESMLVGSWQLDSIFYYHNGFTYTNRAPYPSEVHIFNKDHTFSRRGMGQEKKYTYTVVKDQLTINEVSESTSSKITILQADRSRLVLKKEKPEMFPGKNEELYEIRFFSRE